VFGRSFLLMLGSRSMAGSPRATRETEGDALDLNLFESVVLITGGTDGLGAALARRLTEEGGRVAICGRDADRLARMESELVAAGGDVLAVQADATQPGDLERFVDEAHDRWHRIDGLVNNAGKSAAARIEETSDADWAADFELKIMAAVRLTRLVVPHLRESARGAIVNVLNIGAKAPAAGSLPTTSMRAAGLALTKSLSKELGPAGIRVNAVLVGLIESGQWRSRAAECGRPEAEIYEQLVEEVQVPLGRIGKAEEFADLATFLLSSRSAYITGSAINLDGGSSPVP
jgi:NAD(P)-dependent dehydrogenase (short-subunit alcohol dehydrogenase family)